MTRLEIVLSAILLVSLILNIGVFVYARSAITRLLFVSDELGDLQEMIGSFAAHVKAVYELESFYGDDTLRHLLDHAISFDQQLETFEHIYSLTETDEGKTINERENDEEEA